MVSNDEQAKNYAQQTVGQAQTPGPMVGSAKAYCGDIYARAYGKATPAPTEAGRLREHSNYLREEAMKSSKIANILERHPEFLEFLEVLRSGLV
jgi:hypothetical protein